MPNNITTTPYSDLRQRARALALATLFDKPQARDNICDLLQLGLELEKILEIASEPMLAMIRMQWWCDMFESMTPPQEAPDFAIRLYRNQAVENQSLSAFVRSVQETLQSPEPHMLWGHLFTLLTESNSWDIDRSVMQQLGLNFGALYINEARGADVQLTDKEIKKASKSKYGFPRLINLLIHRQIAEQSNEDNALIFRMVARLLF